MISPIRANVYLRYVYDLWVHRWRRTKAIGDAVVVRYSDTTIVGFEHAHEARTFLQDLQARMNLFHVILPLEKARLNLTIVAALRCDRILIDGPINGESFQAYVEQILLPTLPPGDIVIMDNLGLHKGRAVRDAIRSVGAHRLLLSPQSSDLNPIEQAFAKLKSLLRKVSERTRETKQIDDLLTPLHLSRVRTLPRPRRLWFPLR